MSSTPKTEEVKPKIALQPFVDLVFVQGFWAEVAPMPRLCVPREDMLCEWIAHVNQAPAIAGGRYQVNAELERLFWSSNPWLKTDADERKSWSPSVYAAEKGTLMSVRLECRDGSLVPLEELFVPDEGKSCAILDALQRAEDASVSVSLLDHGMFYLDNGLFAAEFVLRFSVADGSIDVLAERLRKNDLRKRTIQDAIISSIDEDQFAYSHYWPEIERCLGLSPRFAPARCLLPVDRPGTLFCMGRKRQPDSTKHTAALWSYRTNAVLYEAEPPNAWMRSDFVDVAASVLGYDVHEITLVENAGREGYEVKPLGPNEFLLAADPISMATVLPGAAAKFKGIQHAAAIRALWRHYCVHWGVLSEIDVALTARLIDFEYTREARLPIVESSRLRDIHRIEQIARQIIAEGQPDRYAASPLELRAYGWIYNREETSKYVELIEQGLTALGSTEKAVLQEREERKLRQLTLFTAFLSVIVLCSVFVDIYNLLVDEGNQESIYKMTPGFPVWLKVSILSGTFLIGIGYFLSLIFFGPIYMRVFRKAKK